jgi:hypothetical protein
MLPDLPLEKVDPEKTNPTGPWSLVAHCVPGVGQAITYGPAMGAGFGLADSVISSLFGNERPPADRRGEHQYRHHDRHANNDRRPHTVPRTASISRTERTHRTPPDEHRQARHIGTYALGSLYAPNAG